jgi:F-type H+-transporting ATPase subunit a
MAGKSLTDYAFEQVTDKAAGHGWADTFGEPLLNPSNPVSVSHLISSICVFAVIIVLSLIAMRKYRTKEEAVIPEGRVTIRNLFEATFDYILEKMASIMGEEHARRFFPFIATLAVFILLSNLLGLIPGFSPPTDNLNMNLAMGFSTLIVYMTAGFMEHGIGYLKHFLGPSLWVAPIMLFVELLENFIIYPGSLALRLTGNIMGDHIVLARLGELTSSAIGIPLLAPVPLYFLGIIIAFVQTIIFCVLSVVYITLSLEH